MLQNIANADTFPTYKALVEKGKFKPEVAELLINTFKQLSDDFAKNLMTKEEFAEEIDELKKEIKEEIRTAIQESEKRTDYKLALLKKELLIANGLMLFAFSGFLVGAMKLFF